MNRLLNLMGNILCVSVPEEFFIAFLILYLIKIFRIYNHDFFDIHNDFFKKLKRLFLISIIPLSILSNVLNLLKIDMLIISFIGATLIPVSIILFLNIKDKAKCIYIILLGYFSFIVFALLETGTFNVVFYITKTNLQYFNQTFLKSFILTLFERVFEYTFILTVFLSKNAIIKTTLYKTVIKSKLLLGIFGTFVLINSSAFIIFCHAVLKQQILVGVDNLAIVLMVLGMFVLISFNICAMWLFATLIQIKEKYKYKYGKELEI